MNLLSFPLSRLCYAPHGEDLDQVSRYGLAAFVDTQLSPKTVESEDLATRLRTFKLQMKYPAGSGQPNAKGEPMNWPAMDEMRTFHYLDAPIETAWKLLEPNTGIAPAEQLRPYHEVAAATILRAAHGRRQLFELTVAFWHDHFNIAAVDDRRIGCALPSFDKDAIRPHALGNFRDMLEAVAKSPAMLIYLSNAASRAGAANENYARELLELHTLGRDAYLNDRYDRWRAVPGALEGKPQGYIDEDVYEAARAFTGWTVESGQRLDNATELPRTGKFIYVDGWHDGYQKRVLATEFAPFAAPMDDGRKVLDLAAFHPATARFLCFKLCRRFVSDHPSQSLVESSTKVWIENAKKPDQIAAVLKHIILSKEFQASQGQKPRSPLALTASFARVAKIDLAPTPPLFNQLQNCGQRLFGWAAPNGRPDDFEYYMTPESLRERWVLTQRLATNAFETGQAKAISATAGQDRRAGAFVSTWLAEFQGSSAAAPQFLAASGLDPDQLVSDEKRLAQLLGLCAAAPQFQIT